MTARAGGGIEITTFGLDDVAGLVRYDTLFESCQAAYVQQSTAWARAIHDLGPDRPIFLLASKDGVDLAGLPLFLYQAEPGNLLTSVPQPGPLGGIFTRSDLGADTRDNLYAALLARALDLARAHSCLTLSLITNPMDDDLALYERHLAPDFVLRNFTQAVPLQDIFTGDRIVLPRYLRRGGFRYQLRRALNHGFTIRPADTSADLARWYAIHEKRHHELDAPPLDKALFENLLRELQPLDKARLWLIEKDGAMAGGCLLIRHRAVLDVYAVSMNSDFASYAPNYALIDHALRWAHALGSGWFNWQSSPSRTSGVYAFKARWGAEERTYHFVTRRLCPPGRLNELGAEGVKRHYPGHFVVPFGAFDDGCLGGRYHKA